VAHSLNIPRYSLYARRLGTRTSIACRHRDRTEGRRDLVGKVCGETYPEGKSVRKTVGLLRSDPNTKRASTHNTLRFKVNVRTNIFRHEPFFDTSRLQFSRFRSTPPVASSRSVNYSFKNLSLSLRLSLPRTADHQKLERPAAQVASVQICTIVW
jgi:hypothetical protein